MTLLFTEFVLDSPAKLYLCRIAREPADAKPDAQAQKETKKNPDMDLLLILTYAAICYGVFKLFKIPVNAYTLLTAALGGVLLLAMNYNHPYLRSGRSFPQQSGQRSLEPIAPFEPHEFKHEG